MSSTLDPIATPPDVPDRTVPDRSVVGKGAPGNTTPGNTTPGEATLGKLERLREVVRSYPALVVAFSGGADSALLAWIAHEQLVERAHAVTAVSPSLADRELDDCKHLAEEWGMSWSTVETAEMERAAYRRNDQDRCYHCKAELMDVVTPIAAAADATVALGVNTDDLVDHRPGQRAATEAGAVFPLVEAGLDKDEVRQISRLLGLRTWNKPAAACLASRIPHGTEVTVALLGRVQRAEAALKSLGFEQCRVRDHGDIARIEVEADQLARAVANAAALSRAVHACGYRYVTLDIDGFRSGSLNPV